MRKKQNLKQIVAKHAYEDPLEKEIKVEPPSKPAASAKKPKNYLSDDDVPLAAKRARTKTPPSSDSKKHPAKNGKAKRSTSPLKLEEKIKEEKARPDSPLFKMIKESEIKLDHPLLHRLSEDSRKNLMKSIQEMTMNLYEEEKAKGTLQKCDCQDCLTRTKNDQ